MRSRTGAFSIHPLVRSVRAGGPAYFVRAGLLPTPPAFPGSTMAIALIELHVRLSNQTQQGRVDRFQERALR